MLDLERLIHSSFMGYGHGAYQPAFTVALQVHTAYGSPKNNNFEHFQVVDEFCMDDVEPSTLQTFRFFRIIENKEKEEEMKNKERFSFHGFETREAATRF